MQISDTELKKVIATGSLRIAEPIIEEEPWSLPESDKPLIKQLVKEVMEMPDREDRIAEIKAKMDAGEWNPSGSEIAEAMVRRAIADRVR